MKIRTNFGFTILETLYSATIICMVFSLALYNVFDSGARLLNLCKTNSNIQQEEFRLISQMSREIRGCTNLVISNGGSRAEFDVNDKHVVYELVQHPRTGKFYVIKTDGVNIDPRNIANDITSLNFSVNTDGQYEKVIVDYTVTKSILEGGNLATDNTIIVQRRNSGTADPTEVYAGGGGSGSGGAGGVGGGGSMSL